MTNYTIDTKGKTFPIITGVNHYVRVMFNDSRTVISFHVKANYPLNRLDKESTLKVVNELMDDFDYASYNFNSENVCGLSDSYLGTIDWKLRSIVDGENVLYRSGVTDESNVIPNTDKAIKKVLNRRTAPISELDIFTFEDN
jgi:hypothetical protein